MMKRVEREREGVRVSRGVNEKGDEEMGVLRYDMATDYI
jgi:hypothetical protein